MKRVIIILIVLILGLGVYLYFRMGANAQTDRDANAVTVAVSRVQQKDEVVYAQTIGTVDPIATVALKSMVDGQILQVHFKEGDLVTAGQLLFTIDPRPFQVQLQQAQANLAGDKAKLEIAKLALQRNTKLLPQGYIAKQDYDQLIANVQTLAATIKADEATVANAKLQLDYTAITAPISGRTGNLLINAGNLVKANDTNAIVVINQIAPIYVTFALPQQQLDVVRQEFTQQDIQVVAYPDKQSSQFITGKLSFIDNTVDTTTGTIQLKATFANQDQRLWPGQFVTIKLPTAFLKQALIVPTQAVQIGPTGNYFVFVVGENHRVKMRTVTLGPALDDGTVISKGLKVGEQVVTEGQLKLIDGSKVRIAAADKAA